MNRWFSWLRIGCYFACLAVICGAFAAHGLDGFFADKYAATGAKKVAGTEIPAAVKYLNDFKTAAEYQMYHALALVALGLITQRRSNRSLQLAGWCFFLGIVFFSGSLYVLTLTGMTWLGMIAPLGGSAFIVGWLAFAAGSCPNCAASPASAGPSYPNHHEL